MAVGAPPVHRRILGRMPSPDHASPPTTAAPAGGTQPTDPGWRADRIGAALAGRNPTVIAHLPEGFACIGDTQFLPGYCVLLCDDPTVDRLTDLTRSRRAAYLTSMDVLGEAVERACRTLDPDFRRMNYEILGNTDAYLHAHLFPRYEWEQPWHRARPVWLYDPETFYGPAHALDARHDGIRAAITTELVALTG